MRQAAKSATQAAARTATSTTERQALSAANGLEAAIQAAEMAKDLVEKAEKETGDTPIADVCVTCQPPDDEEDDEKDARDAKRVSSNKEADRIARNNRYKDAHDLKDANGYNAKTDLFVGKSGRVYAGAHNGRGARGWLRIYRDGRGYQ